MLIPPCISISAVTPTNLTVTSSLKPDPDAKPDPDGEFINAGSSLNSNLIARRVVEMSGHNLHYFAALVQSNLHT